MKKLLLASTVLLGLAGSANAAVIGDLGVNPTSSQGAFENGALPTGSFADQWTFQLQNYATYFTIASATNVYRIIDANVFAWKSIGRNVDGELQPNIEEIKIVRKSALREDKKSASGDKTASGSSNNETETSLSDKPKKNKGEKGKTQKPKAEKNEK